MPEAESDLQALERFVAENDDLLDLEERIGKFNIFDALGIVRREINHSNFLGWLLDPSESHGQGDLFLKAILMDLLKRADPAKRPLSPIELDGETLGDVEVRREWRNIDLLIASKSPDFVLAIENKVDSGEHSGQLQRYEDIVATEWPDRRRMFVFLTLEGDEASDEDWVSYSYADIHRVLDRVRRTSGSSIGDDVLTFLDHYLNLLGSRFMDDAKLDELCRRIYQNHRRAIDLIAERAMTPSGEVMGIIRSALEEPAFGWTVSRGHSRRLAFIPKEWIGQSHESDGSLRRGFPVGCFCEIEVSPREGAAWLRVVVGESNDKDLRRSVIAELVKAGNPFGFAMKRGTPTDQWTRIRAERLLRWDEKDPPDESVVREKLGSALARLRPILLGVALSKTSLSKLSTAQPRFRRIFMR